MNKSVPKVEIRRQKCLFVCLLPKTKQSAFSRPPIEIPIFMYIENVFGQVVFYFSSITNRISDQNQFGVNGVICSLIQQTECVKQIKMDLLSKIDIKIMFCYSSHIDPLKGNCLKPCALYSCCFFLLMVLLSSQLSSDFLQNLFTLAKLIQLL